ncbi:hypothetical protein [Streptomyces cyaneofuscatus]|uniref:hypothetical protein n=1 Tax=Streptomyces cyaneofuscatus TaxID=66883 RepID=UPI0037B69153
MDLRSAQATWFRDGEQSWPEKVLLDGFTYGAIRSEDSSAAADDGGTRPAHEVARRLDWVRRNPGYSPQPYEQLAGW